MPSLLLLEELPLSDQIAIELARAEKLRAKALALVPSLDPSAAPLAAPCSESNAPFPPVSPRQAGGSFFLYTAETTAMMQEQLNDHPPLQCCAPGHTPHMIQSTGNLRRVFHVECPLCNVATAKFSAMQAAADRWTARDVQPIRAVA